MTHLVTFLGLPMAQEWIDIHIWESFFNLYPVRTFIELGTGNGGLSTYFALQGVQRGIDFHTFDHQKWFNCDMPVPKLVGLPGRYHIQDIFSEAGTNEVANLITLSPKPLAIFFDNGDKPREWKIFAPLTSPGDFCIVHDWDVEFLQKDIGEVKVERILMDLCDTRPRGWKSMWFKRIP